MPYEDWAGKGLRPGTLKEREQKNINRILKSIQDQKGTS